MSDAGSGSPPATLDEAARRLAHVTGRMDFGPPVTMVYRPLEYAWEGHAGYLRRYGQGSKRVLFVGMNPGPWGMVQTGVPFGAIPMVRDWLHLQPTLRRPEREHPRRPVEGMACRRVETSGMRLWGLFRDRFGTADRFFKEHGVMNYCPLAFLEERGRNRTPNQLPAPESTPLFTACDRHLRDAVRLLRPEWVVGVGSFALARIKAAGLPGSVRTGCMLHPSPANPAANRGWAPAAERQLHDQGIW